MFLNHFKNCRFRIRILAFVHTVSKLKKSFTLNGFINYPPYPLRGHFGIPSIVVCRTGYMQTVLFPCVCPSLKGGAPFGYRIPSCLLVSLGAHTGGGIPPRKARIQAHTTE
jgi:hypothetical protein